MAYNLLADLVVVVHFLFVLFSLLGALLVIRWRKMMWLHLPAAIWAAGVEFSGKICPLTPLENWLTLSGNTCCGCFIRPG
jgi:Na+/H+ antiporter NhaB